MSDRSSSGLSDPPSSDEEVAVPVKSRKKLGLKSKRKVDDDVDSEPEETSPAKKKRAPSPPHEATFADNPDIAFIVMFRSRFADAFPPKSVINFGPQDIERSVVESPPTPLVENLLCALIFLVLNRTKPPERGHYGRALEEAIQTNKSQWPRAWGAINPLSGGNSFGSMTPTERITLLKTLIHWSLCDSNKIKDIIKESYKQSRHENDLNQPLSVQSWGRDGDKRRYWLVEGKDDTSFRLYRESNPLLKNNIWISAAGTIDELKLQQLKLEEDGTQAARRLADSIKNAIPRFEATEEKRKRREYRQSRKAQFSRPEPGFSLYEGRTRGKRMRYTFSDEEDYTSDAGSGLRSTRQSGRGTPADHTGPTVTASGRQVRSRQHGAYGESLLSGQAAGDVASPATGEYMRSDGSEEPSRPAHGRATRAAGRPSANGHSGSRRNIDSYNSGDDLDDEDASSDGNEWDGGDEGDDEVKARDVSDDDEEMSDTSDEARSLVLVLRYGKGKEFIRSSPELPSEEPPTKPSPLPKSDLAATAHVAPSLSSILNPQQSSTPVVAQPSIVSPPVAQNSAIHPPTASTTAPVQVAPPPALPVQAQPNAYPLSGPPNGFPIVQPPQPAVPAYPSSPPTVHSARYVGPEQGHYPLTAPPGQPPAVHHPQQYPLTGAPPPTYVANGRQQNGLPHIADMLQGRQAAPAWGANKDDYHR